MATKKAKGKAAKAPKATAKRTTKTAARPKAPAKAKVKPKAKRKVSAIPKGFRSLTPYLIVRGAADALGFYAKAFGARTTLNMTMPDGGVMHAEIKIGDSMLMISEENPDWGSKSPLTLGGSATHVMIYTKDVDAFVARAAAAGCSVEMPAATMFWGDRYAKLKDPLGHQWSVGTHIEDVSPKECQRRAEAWSKQMSGSGN